MQLTFLKKMTSKSATTTKTITKTATTETTQQDDVEIGKNLEIVCQHYADAAKECIYRWEREITNMYALANSGCLFDFWWLFVLAVGICLIFHQLLFASERYNLVSGDAIGSDALAAEDAVLRTLCDARRQLAEAALHRAKGLAA